MSNCVISKESQITLSSIGLTLLMTDVYEKTDGLLPQVY